MAEPNYLLGKGERLVHEVTIKSGGDEKPLPYDFDAAKTNLVAKFQQVAQELDALPAVACPNNEGVAGITLHPGQIAKSYYPAVLLEKFGLRAVGSHSATAVIEQDGEVGPVATTELFVAAPRPTFRKIAEQISESSEMAPWSDDLRRISNVRLVPIESRIKPIHSEEPEIFCEVVLHGAGETATAPAVLSSFVRYAESMGLQVDISHRIDAKNLSFVGIYAQQRQLPNLAKFSFLRAVRMMPRLRHFQPDLPNPLQSSPPFECQLDTIKVRDPNISVAVFDGGMPEVAALHYCVTVHDDVDGIGAPDAALVQHGLAVTSALLFGPLDPNSLPTQAFAHIDHYRVLDVDTANEPAHELYRVLDRITGVLESRHYDYANISLGPAIPTDDDDVHPWTVRLDELAANGATLIVSAAGNSGRSPAIDSLNRIQPPSDGVNVLGVGSCDTDEDFMWRRAPYSSVGHGRSPGIVKPDGVAFGGTPANPFWVIDSYDHSLSWPSNGTSLSSPYVLRTAVGLRAALGGDVMPLAAKALLIHSCENHEGLNLTEVGFGKFCTDVERLITCDDRSVNVIYQDTLEPKRWVQAAIPMIPAEDMGAYVHIKATICIATEVDEHHPDLYTRSGLDIVFRRDLYNVKPKKKTARSTTFFRPVEGVTESDLRRDWNKWETVRRAEGRFQARTLKDPVLDIHYNPRRNGKDAKSARSIPYAMVITVTAPDVTDFYEQVRSRYRGKLDALKPRFRLSPRV